MILLLLLSLALPCTLFGEEQQLSSEKASYDGEHLHLQGRVKLNHLLGNIQAERASLTKGAALPFSFIHLEEKISLTLPGHGTLTCERADLDLLHNTGHLHEKILYREKALEITTESATLDLTQEGANFDVKAIHTESGARIDYLSDFTLMSDHAHYKREKSLSASPAGPSGLCRLLHLGDIIDATEILCELTSQELFLTYPKGMLISSLLPHSEEGEIIFRGDLLTYAQTSDTLHLKGNVRISESSWGTLETKQEVQIQRSHGLLSSLKSMGPSTLFFKHPVTKSPCQLKWHGPFCFDKATLKATFEKAEDGEPLCFEDEEMSLLAQRADIDYAQDSSLLKPIRITLIGQVQLFSHLMGRYKRCSLADRVVYCPTAHTLHLLADEGNKVLFFDEQQSLSMSAPEIQVARDAVTRRDVIKGIGAVKFLLTNEEKSLLGKLFPFYKATP